MLDSFPVQISLWAGAAAASALAFVQMWRTKRDIAERESEIPGFRTLQQQVAELRANLPDLERRAQAAHELIAAGEAAKAQVEVALSQLAETQQQLQGLRVQREELERITLAIAAAKEELVALRQQVKDLSGQQARLATEVEFASAQLEEAKRLEQELRRAIDSLQSKKIELEHVEQHLARVRQELLRLSEALEAQRGKREALDRELAEKLEEIGSLRRDAVELAAQRERLAREVDHDREQLEALRREVQELRREVALLQPKKAELALVEQQLAQVRQELQRLSAAFEVLVSKRQELDRELAGKREESAGLAKRIESQQELLKELRAQQAWLEQERGKGGEGKSEDRYRDLWQPLTFARLPVTKTIPSESKRLEEVADYLQQLGLRFPQRVLYAFHTALKVAEYSPLTVLTGISGTGKSELPRRYAEGMGIHFVGLAVQPRWDSPQDLFGFYNYIEGRYKATELARAMVQFEQYSRGSWPLPRDWNDGRADRMLLVLLDEMNLARVEYYFSEFLSKLEVRRGIREEDPHERAKAEIRIDMGSLGKDEKPIAFYPGRNVLFSGTMNEDESTQTLSDKVLDRACVLRFGRPKQPDSERRTGEAQGSVHGLSLEAWKQWQDMSLASSDSDRVRDWIKKLNDAMNDLGRPFGHRVAQAMHAYVAYYPDAVSSGGPSRVQRAFADQIEQRILPKLRGLDLEGKEGPLKAIREVLQACEDRQLLQAFDEGKGSDQGFLWRGLDRSEA